MEDNTSTSLIVLLKILNGNFLTKKKTEMQEFLIYNFVTCVTKYLKLYN